MLFRWFELVDIVHKVVFRAYLVAHCLLQLFLTSLLVFIDQSAQLPAAICISTAYFMLIILAQPYLFSVNLRLHLVAQVDLVMFMIAGVSCVCAMA